MPTTSSRPASGREISDYLLDRALRAQGIVSLDSICHLSASQKAGVRRLIEARVRKKTLPIELKVREPKLVEFVQRYWGQGRSISRTRHLSSKR